MDCCNPKNKKSELKEALCPSCHKKGKTVGRETPESLVKSDKVSSVTQAGYLFCPTPECDVVYYSEDPAQTFRRADLKVPVTAKDPALSVPVCYCFQITRQKILDDLRTTGDTPAFQEISQKIKEGLCACETMNPQGSCCLGNVSKWIKTARATAAREVIPVKVVAQKR